MCLKQRQDGCLVLHDNHGGSERRQGLNQLSAFDDKLQAVFQAEHPCSTGCGIFTCAMSKHKRGWAHQRCPEFCQRIGDGKNSRLAIKTFVDQRFLFTWILCDSWAGWSGQRRVENGQQGATEIRL